ncbi:PaaI family thioesterase [Novosphingobium lentum]|uniref:PaaI family thioesterase n=1 Tax=Novosphingobium lentum TaxID=145287 RepID=UPI0008319B9E
MDNPPPPPPARSPWAQDSGFDPVKAAAILSSYGHGGFLGMRYEAHGPDWIELGLDWREDLVGMAETGVLASGPIISLLDNATSLAVWIRRGAFMPQVTLDLRIDYVRAAIPGKAIVARGECYQLKRSVGFVRGIAHDGDPADPVAHATGVFMLLGADGA